MMADRVACLHTMERCFTGWPEGDRFMSRRRRVCSQQWLCSKYHTQLHSASLWLALTIMSMHSM